MKRSWRRNGDGLGSIALRVQSDANLARPRRDGYGNDECYRTNTTPNVSEFPIAFKVVSDTPDVMSPEVTAVRISAAEVDVTNGPQTVDVSLDVRDDLSGVLTASAQFRSPHKSGA